MPVSTVRCSTYDGEVLRACLVRLLDDLGGLSRFVRAGQHVLIKPNLLAEHPPEAAVTTHPEVVRVLIRLLRECGVEVSVGDSPASVTKLERVWEASGFTAMCREEGVELVNLEAAGSQPVSVAGCTFSVSQPVLDADVVINVPKVKTHVLTTLTAAVKNLYGTIPGYQKTELHKQYPRGSDFGRLVAAVARHVKPALSIADGVIGMQGNGPSGGTPAAFGFLAASSDCVALDLVLCRLLGIAPRRVPYLRELAPGARGEDVPVVGDSPDGVAPARIRLPVTLGTDWIPRPLVRMIVPLVWIRPEVTDACIACGKCVRACPVEALAQAPGAHPVLTPARCIGCCCCHEVCPARAIEMTPSPLIRLFRGGRAL